MIKISNEIILKHTQIIYIYLLEYKLKKHKIQDIRVIFQICFQRVVFLPDYLKISVQKQSMDYKYLLIINIEIILI